MASNGTTPTVSEFLNAANRAYANSGGDPADLKPFLVDGRQLSYTNTKDGITAMAWSTPGGQVIAAYQGTQFVSAENFVADPVQSFVQVAEDVGVADGRTPPGEVDAAAFARQVAAAANARDISSSDVFLTGHSLGGIQAQYAAQQTGLGGVAFESTGIPHSNTSAGTGENFVNIVTYGDSVGNYSSDVDAEQPFSPAYVPGGAGALPHYGYVAMIGAPGDEAALKTEAQTSSLGPLGVGLTTAAYGAQLAAFHLPGVQAHDLGVTLTQQLAGDQVGVFDRPVLDAADYTIPQLIQATNASFSAPMPPVDGVSPSSGPYAGQAAKTISEGESLARLAAVAVCYAKGTRILTADGEVAVEDLALGDVIVCASGEHRPIRWLGRRSYIGRFANRNPDVLPVCFKAGSLADDVPLRDLWVSPKHAMFLDGVLVPAEHLVNGTTVTKAARVDRIDYRHIELDSHDVLLAEGAPSESFVDDDGRQIFHNAHEHRELYPDEVRTEAVYCASRLEHGPAIETIRRRIDARATASAIAASAKTRTK